MLDEHSQKNAQMDLVPGWKKNFAKIVKDKAIYLILVFAFSIVLPKQMPKLQHSYSLQSKLPFEW